MWRCFLRLSVHWGVKLYSQPKSANIVMWWSRRHIVCNWEAVCMTPEVCAFDIFQTCCCWSDSMAYIVTDWLLGIQKSAYCALIQCCHQCWLHFVLTYFVGVCSFITEISQQPDHRHFSFFVVIDFIFQRFCVSITLGQTVHETKWVWKFPAKDEKSQVFWCVWGKQFMKLSEFESSLLKMKRVKCFDVFAYGVSVDVTCM